MAAAGTIRRRVVIRGRVQGVFFRGSTEEVARRAGVAGWVRNRPDGCVEAAFEGDAAAVEKLVAFCHRGPSWADVAQVDVEEEEPEGELDFRIRR